MMDVTIRIVSKYSKKRDKLVSDFPCIVKIQGNHNHSTESAEALRQLNVQESTKSQFHKYFELGKCSKPLLHLHLQQNLSLSYM